ncbi:MAG TPA: iron-enterobactin transporter ATP-binding protein, partial [Virgibacillus sp.]|nr:iron-enterobactin transporter ATP-binding protein [Virgibacillus sp.]
QPDVLKKVFQIDAAIGRDPRTNKPMCVTYNLLKGEQDNEKTINPIPHVARASY